MVTDRALLDVDAGERVDFLVLGVHQCVRFVDDREGAGVVTALGGIFDSTVLQGGEGVAPAGAAAGLDPVLGQQRAVVGAFDRLETARATRKPIGVAVNLVDGAFPVVGLGLRGGDEVLRAFDAAERFDGVGPELQSDDGLAGAGRALHDQREFLVRAVLGEGVLEQGHATGKGEALMVEQDEAVGRWT